MYMGTTLTEREKGIFSGNQLKILAALFMVCDHVGMFFFPGLVFPSVVWRCIGRVAYPIFAFFIAEGCRYTKNRSRYLAMLTVMGVVFHLVYSYATKDSMLNVIVSFALAVCLIYFWQFFVGFIEEKKYLPAALTLLFAAAYLYFCYRLCNIVHLDYYFGGIFLPLLVYLSKKKWVRLCLFGVGICIVVLCMREFARVGIWALVAVPVMALYNGKRGEWKMKYFFYLFYPLHIAILYGISLLIGGSWA